MASKTTERIVRLSPFDMMGPVVFTRLLYFFKTHKQPDYELRARLTTALTNMIRRDPFLAGTVQTHEFHGKGHRALMYDSVLPANFEADTHGILRFHTSYDKYEDIMSADFVGDPGECSRYHWLEKNLIAQETEVMPVVAFQVNFMRGGLVLAFWSNHAVLDGSSQARLMHPVMKELASPGLYINGSEVLKPPPSVNVEELVGFQKWHAPLDISEHHASKHMQKPDNIGVTSSIIKSAPDKAHILIRRLTFRVEDLQRIRRLDGSNTAPFRCAVALIFVALARARVKAGLVAESSVTTLGIISEFRAALGADPRAIGNYASYNPMETATQELLGEDRLDTLPDTLIKVLEDVCAVIASSKSAAKAQHLLAWTSHQIYNLHQDPRYITYCPPNNENTIFFNSWELLGFPAHATMVGELQRIRKPYWPKNGQVIFMPNMGRTEYMTCLVGLPEEAMRVLMEELEGWLVSNSAV